MFVFLDELLVKEDRIDTVVLELGALAQSELGVIVFEHIVHLLTDNAIDYDQFALLISKCSDCVVWVRYAIVKLYADRVITMEQLRYLSQFIKDFNRVTFNIVDYLDDVITANELLDKSYSIYSSSIYLRLASMVCESRTRDVAAECATRYECEKYFSVICLNNELEAAEWMLLAERLTIKAYGKPLPSYDRNKLTGSGRKRVEHLLNTMDEV